MKTVQFRNSFILVGLVLSSVLLTNATGPGDVTALAPIPDVARPNIILVIVDTVRADHLTPYGYERATTPNLDRLVAQQGVVFADTTSTAPWTLPSNTAMATGELPSFYNVNWHDGQASLPYRAMTLAEHLREAGYYTAGFIASVVNEKRGFKQGFVHFDDNITRTDPDPQWWNVRAAEMNQEMSTWLEDTWKPRLSNRPLFLLAYYFDPHARYDPPAPYDLLYDPTYTGTLTAEAYDQGKPVVLGQIQPTPRDTEHLKALYDGELTYWDAQFQGFLGELERLGLLNNSLLVFTSDHGEMFGEHGLWVHHNSLTEEILRVPLVMRYPGVIPAGQRITTPVQNMDLMPTILDYAGLPIPGNLQAVSLRSLIEGAKPTPRYLFSEVEAVTDPKISSYWTAPHVDLRSVRWDQWKLLHTLSNMSADQLYQLQSDSVYETENVVELKPTVARPLRQALFNQYGISPLPLTSAVISGPVQLQANKASVFQASLYPRSNTNPLTYTWSPEPALGQGTASAAYVWAATGVQRLTLTVTDPWGSLTDQHTVVVQAGPPTTEDDRIRCLLTRHVCGR